jgi:hypothetical protein
MSRLLKSFDKLPLELVAADTMADGNVSLQFPALHPQATSPGAANLLVLPMGRPRAPFADTDGWRHGGINE